MLGTPKARFARNLAIVMPPGIWRHQAEISPVGASGKAPGASFAPGGRQVHDSRFSGPRRRLQRGARAGKLLALAWQERTPMVAAYPLRFETDPMQQTTAKILVVDDNAQNRALAQATLEDEGYSVILAETGEEGLRAVQSQRPD